MRVKHRFHFMKLDNFWVIELRWRENEKGHDSRNALHAETPQGMNYVV